MRRSLRRLLNRPLTRPRARLGVEALESREVPANLALGECYLLDTAGNKVTTPDVGQIVELHVQFKTTALPNTPEMAKYDISAKINGVERRLDSAYAGFGVAGTSVFDHTLGPWLAAPGKNEVKINIASEHVFAETSFVDNNKSFNFTPTAFKGAFGGETKFTAPLAGQADVHWKLDTYVDVDPENAEFGRSDWKGFHAKSARTLDGQTEIQFVTAAGFETQHVGLPVLAAAGGVVMNCDDYWPDEDSPDDGKGQGNYVAIDHGNGWKTVYSHLRQFSVVVQPGDVIPAGRPIALIGSSGNDVDHVALGFSVFHNGHVVETYAGGGSGYWNNPLPYSGLDGAILIPYGEYHVVEGQTVDVQFTRPFASPTIWDYDTENKTAKNNEDYFSASDTLYFDAAESSQWVTLETHDDAKPESSEYFRVNFLAAFSGTQLHRDVTILDNDVRFNFQNGTLKINPSYGHENETVTLDVVGGKLKVTSGNTTDYFPLNGPGGKVESIELFGGFGDDTFNVYASPAGVETILGGGLGNNVVNIGRPGDIISDEFTLGSIKGTVKVTGDPAGFHPTSAFVRDNSSLNPGKKYTLDDTALAWNGGKIRFGALNYLSLETGNGNDTFAVTALRHLEEGAELVTAGIDGGGGKDTIVGADLDQTFEIWDKNFGFLYRGDDLNLFGFHTVYFASVENLTGGSKADTFDFWKGASLGGNVAGLAGHDRLMYAQFDTAVDVNLATGKATAIGGTFSGIDGAVGGWSTSDRITAGVRVNDWAITGENKFSLNGIFDGDDFENLRGNVLADNFAFANGAGVTGLVEGQGGTDTLDYSKYTSAVTVDLATKSATGTDGVASIEKVIGGTAIDTLGGVGAAAGVNLWNITGKNAGTFAGAGANVSFTDIENLNGYSNIDWFVFDNNASVDGKIDGRGGSDLLDYSNYTTSVWLNVATHTLIGAGAYASIESFTGGSGSDMIIGWNAANNWVLAGKNAGVLNGDLKFTGVESLVGGQGANAFIIANGASLTGGISGSEGPDLLDYSAWTTPVSVNLTAGTATGIGTGIFAIDHVTGGAAGDTLVGNNFRNVLRGNGGKDVLDGGDGDDLILGGADNDTITGGAGRDFLVGGLGQDQLDGGNGDDLLIGGTTKHDEKINVLLTMLDTWSSLEFDYQHRVGSLKNTGVFGGFYKLNGAAVIDDGVNDALAGGMDLDWFWTASPDTTDAVDGEKIN